MLGDKTNHSWWSSISSFAHQFFRAFYLYAIMKDRPNQEATKKLFRTAVSNFIFDYTHVPFRPYSVCFIPFKRSDIWVSASIMSFLPFSRGTPSRQGWSSRSKQLHCWRDRGVEARVRARRRGGAGGEPGVRSLARPRRERVPVNPRDELLCDVRALCPRVVTLVEQELNATQRL